jgi:hypothetical protein
MYEFWKLYENVFKIDEGNDRVEVDIMLWTKFVYVLSIYDFCPVQHHCKRTAE